MKKKLFFVLGLLMAVVVQAQTYWNGTSDKTFSGSGTQSDPYLIGTPEQLAGLAELCNDAEAPNDFAGQYIKLTADIYLTNFNDLDTANWKEWTTPIARTDRHSQSGAGSETTITRSITCTTTAVPVGVMIGIRVTRSLTRLPFSVIWISMR